MSAAILQLLNSATSTEMWVLEMYEEVCFGVILLNCFEMNSKVVYCWEVTMTALTAALFSSPYDISGVK